MKRISQLLIALHVAATISCLYFSCKILAEKENEKTGVFTLKFGSHVFERGVFNPVKSIEAKASDIATHAASLETKVPDIVSSAVGAVETLIDSAIPRECAVGTRYGCVGSDSDLECTQLPVSHSDELGSLLGLIPAAKPLSRYLGHIPQLRAFLIVGLAFALASLCSLPLLRLVPFVKFATFGLSLAALIFFGAFGGLALSILRIASTLQDSIGGDLDRGYVYTGAIGAIVSSAVFAAAAVVGLWFHA